MDSPLIAGRHLKTSQLEAGPGPPAFLHCDAIIREKTDGAKSLDDFCKRFFAAVPGKKTVAGYDLDDVVRELNAVAEYDWGAFLRRRVAARQESLPLDVVGRLGYRLKYADKPAGGGRPGAPPDNPAADSLGLSIRDGVVGAVGPGLPADKAGLAPGMKVIGVNGKKFSLNRLRDAIADSVTRKKVELLIEDGEEFRRLAQFIAGTRFWDMEAHYDFRDAVVSDAPGSCVLVATASRRKLVGNYADAGPPELWAIAGLIDLLLHGVEWEQRHADG